MEGGGIPWDTMGAPEPETIYIYIYTYPPPSPPMIPESGVRGLETALLPVIEIHSGNLESGVRGPHCSSFGFRVQGLKFRIWVQ